MATKLRAIPITATAPSAVAVIGAVARVAPTDEPSVLHHTAEPRIRSVHRLKVVAPHRAAAESQPPKSTIAQGSNNRTHRQVAERSALGSTLRCRTRLIATNTASA